MSKREELAIAKVLDRGIMPFVMILRNGGIETFESCEGGKGHAFLEPTIRFHGELGVGWKALHIAQEHALPVSEIRRSWPISNGEPTGPFWVMTFSRRANDVETAFVSGNAT